jgi:hypothetical protein
LGNMPTPSKPTDIDKDVLSQADDHMLKDIGASSAGRPLSICKSIPAPAFVVEVIANGSIAANEIAVASADRRDPTVMTRDVAKSISAYQRCDGRSR